MSWRRVAQETHIEVTALHRILRGTHPDVSKYVALTDWMGTAMDAFMDGIPPEVLTNDTTGSLHVQVPHGVSPHRWEAFKCVVTSAIRLLQDDGINATEPNDSSHDEVVTPSEEFGGSA